MDRRDIFKIKLQDDKSEARAVHYKNKRAQARNKIHFNTRNIDVDISPAVSDAPETKMTSSQQGNSNGRENFRSKYMKWKKENQKSSKLTYRPPFITVVPVGRYVEPPQEDALIKRLLKQRAEAENRFKSTQTTVDKSGKCFAFGSTTTQRETRTMKKKNKENVFKFERSTAPETKQNKNAFTIVSADDLFDGGISPIEADCSDENQTPTTDFNTTVNIETSPAGTEILHTHDDETDINNVTIEIKDRPIDLNESVNRYVSPYVMTARGKGSAKRERAHRRSVYKLDSPNDNPNEDEDRRRNREAALYFEKSLNSEIMRLEGMAEKWSTLKSESGDCLDMIDVTVGQTRLLIAKKFEQFRGLIIQCRENSGSQKVVDTDLEGFWGMLKIQIEDLDKRYANLDAWRANGWCDPEAAAVVERPKKRGRPSKKNKASKGTSGQSGRSELKDLIKSMRAQKLGSTSEEEVIISTKNVVNASPRLSRRRASVLIEKEKTPKPSPRINITEEKNSNKKTATPSGRRSSLRNASINDAYRDAADKYEDTLNDEILRLNTLANDWDAYKVENAHILNSENNDAIDVVTGQTRLLVRNKFKQFRGLINHCRNRTGAQPTTPNDLEGFWSMLLLQVDNLDQRFGNLEILKNNNWMPTEIVQEQSKKGNKNKKIKGGRITKKKNKRASFKSYTKHLFKNIMAQGNEEATINENNKSPKLTTPRRKSIGESLLASVLKSEAKKRVSSPFVEKPARGRPKKSVTIKEDALTIELDDIKFMDDTITVVTPPRRQRRTQFLPSPKDGEITPVMGKNKQNKRKYTGTPRFIKTSMVLDEPELVTTPTHTPHVISERHSPSRRNRRLSLPATPKSTKLI